MGGYASARGMSVFTVEPPLNWATYMEFLEQLAEAGVQSYRVDMSERTITYMGASGEKYVEKVPDFD